MSHPVIIEHYIYIIMSYTNIVMTRPSIKMWNIYNRDIYLAIMMSDPDTTKPRHEIIMYYTDAISQFDILIY